MIETRYPSLAGRAMVISGGASGIGEAFVRAFAAQSAKVTFIDLDVQAGNNLAETLHRDGAQVFHQACDVTDITALRACLSGQGLRTLAGRQCTLPIEAFAPAVAPIWIGEDSSFAVT